MEPAARCTKDALQESASVRAALESKFAVSLDAEQTEVERTASAKSKLARVPGSTEERNHEPLPARLLQREHVGHSRPAKIHIDCEQSVEPEYGFAFSQDIPRTANAKILGQICPAFEHATISRL